MKGLGIRKRLLLLAVLPGSLIAFMLFIYFTRGQLDLAEESLRDRGLTIARQLAPTSEFGFVTGSQELLEQLAAALLQQSDITGIAIADAENRPHFLKGTLVMRSALPLPSAKETSLCESAGEYLIFCAPITKTELQISDFPGEDEEAYQQRVIGWVYLEMSTHSLQEQRSRIISRALLITTLLLLLTGVVAVYIGRQISLPIVAIKDAVDKVAAGELELHISAGSPGEIGQLERGIDGMINSLRLARDEMRLNIDNATAQLRKALAELEERNLDLEEQRISAQAANEAKSRFLANMSHEIRTPLSGMVGVLFMLRQTQPTPVQREYLENLENSATTLRALIDDILDLSRIEAGRLTIHEQEFVLRDLLVAVAAMLSPGAHQKGVEFIVHVDREVPHWMMGDPLRLRQILTNLIGNAVKFTERGYVRLQVSCLPDKASRNLLTRFVVEDSGIGIAPDKLNYIFESFAQADESTTRRYGGSGLGTTIARELVELMGGTLKVESEEGQGTRFTCELPLGFVESEEEESPPHAGARVMLLERHEPSRLAEREMLEMLGFAVQEFDSADSLKAALATDAPPQLLVLAENDRNPFWQPLAAEVRKRFAGQAFPKILHLTFFYGADDPSLFDAVLHKPLDLEHLKKKLGQILDGEMASSAETESAATDAVVLNILVAEDDAINAKVMTFFLQNKGHRVVVAVNGREALELLRQQPFDVGFLDMRMPEIDGMMVARQWRKEERGDQRLPLIAVTANVTREDRAACFEAGMDDFISKPVDPVRLSELLERYVQSKIVAT